MGLTVDNIERTVFGNKRITICDVDFDTSYPTGGEALTPETLGLGTIDFLIAEPKSGRTFEYDYTNEKLIAYGSGSAGQTIAVQDDDNAASTGTALYVHIDEALEQGSYLAHLESVTAGNADSYFALSSGGAQVRVQDDDAAASGGFALYFDEDGTSGSRFQADLDNLGDADVFVMCSNGEFIRINDAETASGVQVYFDDDAANIYERLLFVSPTNADGSDVTDATISLRRDGAEVANATNLSGLTNVRVFAVGHGISS